MSSTMTTTLGMSNLRTTSRQTRTNPTRSSKTIGSSLRQNSLISTTPIAPTAPTEPHGFYPAITHFTDAIKALPQEFRRHISLLKEVDAKSWEPEENLQNLLKACAKIRPPAPKPGRLPGISEEADDAATTNAPPTNNASATPSAIETASQHSAQSLDPAARNRAILYRTLRFRLLEIMPTIDEKNHVINNANDELSRHLKRLDNVYPHIANEISEEARLGSLTHWAYENNKASTKATTQSARREAATSLAIMHDSEIANRSELRREAVQAKKHRQAQLDSDFEIARAPVKRVNGSSKAKRVGELTAEASLGADGASHKKRKTERAPAAVPMERSASTMAKGGISMSRDPSMQENTKKRKAPVQNATVARKKINTAGFKGASPALVLSPQMGTFGKDIARGSPAPSAMRPQSSRVRQNSTQNVKASEARAPSSASVKPAVNGNAVAISTTELQSVAALTGKSTTDIKDTLKGAVNGKGDRLLEDAKNTDIGILNGEQPLHGAVLLERSSSRSGTLKKEADAEENGTGAKNGARGSPRNLPPPLLVPESNKSDRPARGRSSKPATPQLGSFPDSSDASETNGTLAMGNKTKKVTARTVRQKDQLVDSLSPTGLPLKRSHKKGAGMAAQAAALRAKELQQPEDDAATSSMADEDYEEAPDGDEEKYCICQQGSYGEMVACDAKDCPTEWFHLSCVGLKTAPGKNAKWYCDDCKENLKKGKSGTNGK